MNRGGPMIGVLMKEKEVHELEFILKKELEELLLDMTDHRIDKKVRHLMEEKYKIIFGIYRRFAHPSDCMKYIKPSLSKQENEK